MLVTPEGMAISDSPPQLEKARLSMPVTLLGIVTLSRLPQSAKAELIMIVTPSGIVTETAGQFEKFLQLGDVTVVRDVHSLNVFDPRRWTMLEGTETLFKPVQP